MAYRRRTRKRENEKNLEFPEFMDRKQRIRKLLFTVQQKKKHEASGARAITGGAKPGWAGPARQQRAASQDSFADLQNRVRASADVLLFLLSTRPGCGLFASSCARPLPINCKRQATIPSLLVAVVLRPTQQHEPGENEGLSERNK